MFWNVEPLAKTPVPARGARPRAAAVKRPRDLAPAAAAQQREVGARVQRQLGTAVDDPELAVEFADARVHAALVALRFIPA